MSITMADKPILKHLSFFLALTNATVLSRYAHMQYNETYLMCAFFSFFFLSYWCFKLNMKRFSLAGKCEIQLVTICKAVEPLKPLITLSVKP